MSSINTRNQEITSQSIVRGAAAAAYSKYETGTSLNPLIYRSSVPIMSLSDNWMISFSGSLHGLIDSYGLLG
jgi:hypothetical protein